MLRSQPPFRADHVGSLLRRQALKEAREKRAKGEITADALKAVEDREIERVIRKQEEVGLQSITDGELRRSWWHLAFLWGLKGIEKFIPASGVPFAGVQTRQEGTKVTGRIGANGHPMLEHFRFLAEHTKRTPKMTIPAPTRDTAARCRSAATIRRSSACSTPRSSTGRSRRLPKRKLAVLGIVTTKRGALESKDELKRRIDEAANYAPLEQLCISGQCGFASTEEGNVLTEDEQWAKLARLVEVADEIWR